VVERIYWFARNTIAKKTGVSAETGQGSWQQVESLPVAARIQVAVPRSAGKAARSANLKLRYAKMKLKAPAHKTKYLGLDEPLEAVRDLIVASYLLGLTKADPKWRRC
jgi:hypothetical protein